MSTRFCVLAAFLCLLFDTTQNTVQALEIKGEIRFGSHYKSALIVGIPDRNLYAIQPEVLASLPVASIETQSTTFALTTPEWPQTYLMVAFECSTQDIHAGRFDQCILLHPRLLPVQENQTIVLELPDLRIVHQQPSNWSTRDRIIIRLIGYLIIALFLFLAWRFRRSDHTPDPAKTVEQSSNRLPSLGWLFFIIAAIGYTIGLGADDLGLLEYTYFQEGMRPERALDILGDSISTELAHGPIYPLILRMVGHVSTSELALRLPSVLFGAALIGVTVSLIRQILGTLPALTAGFIALLNPLIAYYAQDATPYALAALSAAASLWFLFQIKQNGGRWIDWSGLVIFQWIGFFSHYGYAFVSFATFIGCCLAWRKQNQHRLSKTVVAFCIAAVPLVWLTPNLLDVLQISGVRFSLMSPIYPEDPGLWTYVGQFLTVLSGCLSGWEWTLLLVIPVWLMGTRILWHRTRFLAWICIVQMVIFVLFVLFNHAMYTSHGGDRVFFAFRYATPLVLCMILPLAASITSKAKWLVWGLVLIFAYSTAPLWTAPTRAAQSKAATMLLDEMKTGDAFAVVPASFYGGPFQFHLMHKNPDDFITRDRAAMHSIDEKKLWGPLMETHTPLPTQVAHLGHDRLWVIAYSEHMFGLAKFDPAIVQSNIEHISMECGPPSKTVEMPFITVFQFDCSKQRIWGEKTTYTVDATNSFALDRWIVRPQKARHIRSNEPFSIHRPDDCRAIEIRAEGTEMTEDSLQFSADNAIQKPSFVRNGENRATWTIDFQDTVGIQTLQIVPHTSNTPQIKELVFRR